MNLERERNRLNQMVSSEKKTKPDAKKRFEDEKSLYWSNSDCLIPILTAHLPADRVALF